MRALLAALILATLSCATSAGAFIEYEPMDPPEVYRAWFEDAKGCSGWEGDFGRIRWYVVTRNSSELGAWWHPPTDRIFVDAENTMRRAVVIHEMLHFLRQKAGPDAHDHWAFTTCGRIVH